MKTIKFTPKQLRMLVESEMNAGRGSSSADLKEALIQSIRNEWNMLSDESGDPVISEYGEEAWEKQVRNAIAELSDRIELDIEEVTEKLIDGDFF